MLPARRSAAEWAGRLRLKRSGHEFVGPCPYCGGRDRFHVREGHSGAMVGCRGCIDGLGKTARIEAFRRIVRIVYGEEQAPTSYRRNVHKEEIDRDDKRAEEAAQEAQRMIHDADYQPHPYLARKGFPDEYVLIHKMRILLPIRSRKGKVMSAQLIDDEGAKKFLTGSRVKGGQLTLGRARRAVVVEGYATALSVRRALAYLNADLCVRVAFSLSNIPHVCRKGDAAIIDHDTNPLAAPASERVLARLHKAGINTWRPPEPGDANDFHQAHSLRDLAYQTRALL